MPARKPAEEAVIPTEDSHYFVLFPPGDRVIYLLYHVLSVIMPRGQKSKLRARERRHQAQVEPQNPVGAQAIVGVGEEFPSSFSSWKAIS